MNLSDEPGSLRVERVARWIAIVSGLAAFGLLWIDPGVFTLAY